MGSSPAIERRRPQVERRRSRRGPAAGSDCRDGSAPTLEEVVLAAFAQIEAKGRASCPVCEEPSLSAGGCSSCGSKLS